MAKANQAAVALDFSFLAVAKGERVPHVMLESFLEHDVRSRS